MSLHYAHFCDLCGATHRAAVSECERCGSEEITRAATHASVVHTAATDAAADARLHEAQLRWMAEAQADEVAT